MYRQEIHSALQSADEEVRRSALHSLKKKPCPDAQTLIVTAMGDESWRVRKEAVECYLSLQPDSGRIEQLLALLRNEDNAGLRNSAAETVIRLGAVAAVPLLNMVQDRDAAVRKFVIDVMGAIGDPLFVPALVRALDDPDVNVASAAAEQLGVLGGDADVAERLMRSLLARDEVLFRFSALRALTALAQPAPVPAALVRLTDQDVLRSAVFDCLGAIADAGSVTVLLDGFSSPRKKDRTAAVKSTYKIYQRSSAAAKTEIRGALQALAGKDSIAGLVGLSDVRDAVLTDALLWVGAETRDPRFIPLLIEGYDDERPVTPAFSALKGFDRAALHESIARYPDLDEFGRSGLCALIAECGYTEFSSVIREGVYDPSAQVRKAAALAAGKLNLIQLLSDLITLIDDGDAQVVSAAIASLQSLAGTSGTPVFEHVERLCSSPAPHHRKAAAHLLASLRNRERLLLLMKDEDAQVRAAAVSAIGINRIEATGAMLVLALTDEDPDVRIAAAGALGQLQDTSVLDALEYAMNDEDVWVKSAVLQAVASIEPARARALINDIHAGAEGLLMITCLKILEQSGGPEAEQIIRNALHHTDRDIARQAAMSLERVIASDSCSGDS